VSRVPALIVMHGDLAAELLRSASLLYGPVEGVEVLSNQNLSRAGLEEEIAKRVASWTEGGLVLTDLWGGSCHICGASASRGREVVVLSGLNLPILLDYLHNRDTIPAAELAERLLRKGQDSIRLQRAPS
jgi:mannose/fructose-specific phosphotransferase system component IIA